MKREHKLPEREIRRTKNVRVTHQVKEKIEEDGVVEVKKYLKTSIVSRPTMPTRCCTRCGFSDLDCNC